MQQKKISVLTVANADNAHLQKAPVYHTVHISEFAILTVFLIRLAEFEQIKEGSNPIGFTNGFESWAVVGCPIIFITYMPTHSLAVLTDTIVHLFHPDDMVIVIEQRQIPRIPPPVLVSARLLYRNRTS
jgi:hypothetical protein